MLTASRKEYSTAAQFKAQNEEQMQRAFIGYCRGALAGYYAGLTGKPLCVDKSRDWFFYYDWLKMFHSEPKILVCIRDLRAILSSMEKLFLKNPDKMDELDDQMKMNMISKPKRVLHWLNCAPVGITVTRLLDALERGNTRYFHFVRFEEITTTPEQVMRGVYEYLGEPYFEHNFDQIEQLTHENDSYYSLYGRHVIRQKIAPVPLDYHDVLGKDICNVIRRDNEAFYQAFYNRK
jgi:sulfotransferase